MSIVFRKLDQSIFALNKKGQATCLACLGVEKTQTSTTTFLLSFLYMRSSRCKMRKLLLVTYLYLCIKCMYMRERCFLPLVFYLKISPLLILFQDKEERQRKKNAIGWTGGEKHAQDSFSEAADSRRMPHSPMDILGKYPRSLNIPTKIY